MSGFKMDDYVPVQERVDAFIKAYPEGSLQSEIVELTDSRVTVKGYAYRKPDDPRPGIGHSSLNIPGATSFTKGSEIENAETSAWGRAIAALGFEVKRGIASAEEVRNKPQRTPQSATARERLAEVASAHDISADDLSRYADRVGIQKGVAGTDEQIEQIIALIEQPDAPIRPAQQESVPSGGQDVGARADVPAPPANEQPGGGAPPAAVPADITVDQILEAAGPGAELVPEKPEYVKKAEARAAAAKAAA